MPEQQRFSHITALMHTALSLVPAHRRLHEFQLKQEVNHLLAVYRSLLQLLGSCHDTPGVRQELIATRQLCLKNCDSAKNYVLPHLKSDNAVSTATESATDDHSPSDYSEQATQLIGCVSAFLIELKRTLRLYDRLSKSDASKHQAQSSSTNATSAASNPGLALTVERVMDRTPSLRRNKQQIVQTNASPISLDPATVVAELKRDISEAEDILSTLENAITVHFSDKDAAGAPCVAVPRSRRKMPRATGWCLKCRTAYA